MTVLLIVLVAMVLASLLPCPGMKKTKNQAAQREVVDAKQLDQYYQKHQVDAWQTSSKVAKYNQY